ncbi:glycosyltransferase family 2 protein [Levilactobacillus enshiensis]|uniref:glycosyltransferase family 2 protein n=1 Tax=Levilactobacillus enshiensis TaxID=2590213 RepID=UPI00117BB5AF|nr:glycosyltransferase family 2 protein [Levilactobacillus enshiensis]
MKISIVTPVYNVQDYLDRCLNSMLSQSYRNLEIILVDDGSTDRSLDICRRFEAKDPRIRLIVQKNSGVSSARNAGLKAVTGDYIFFLDADDWIERDYIRRCVDALMLRRVDLLFTPYIREYKSNPIHNDLFKQCDMSFDKAKVSNFLLRRFFGEIEHELMHPAKTDDFSAVWGKFYRADICKKISFVDTKIIGNEDAWFNINFISNANSAKYFGSVYYHYYKENKTSFITVYDANKFEGWKNLYKLMDEYIHDNDLGNDYKQALNNRKITDLMDLARNVASSNMRCLVKIKKMKMILNDEMYDESFKAFDFSFLNLPWRFFFKLCQHKHSLVVLIILKLAEPLKKILK